MVAGLSLKRIPQLEVGPWLLDIFNKAPTEKPAPPRIVSPLMRTTVSSATVAEGLDFIDLRLQNWGELSIVQENKTNQQTQDK